jgi:hypothetical protein
VFFTFCFVRLFIWVFYAPVSKDRGHIVFGLSVCVCLQKL